MHIDSYSFGRICIDGVDYGLDLIIVGGDVHTPWWREAGGHVFAPDDLELVIAAAPEVVCLGTGYFGRVRVDEATLAAFHDRGTEVVVDRTGPVVERFNRLVEDGSDAAAALHLTC
jgi:hypothetical protein